MAVFCLSAPARAAGGDGRMQLLFIGAAPEAGLSQGVPADLPVVAIEALPAADAVEQEVFAARLRANPVSTFVSGPVDAAKPFDQFFLVARATLDPSGEDYRLTLGDDRFTMQDFAGRLGSAVQAFDPRHKRIGFLQIVDDADQFPMALPDLQPALEGLGFDMLVLTIAGQAQADCAEAQPLHYSIVSGLADRAPFGDGDGLSTVAEVEAYLGDALNRAKARGCGPAYSLILRHAEDPAQVLVQPEGSARIVEIEKQLYHETFEAMFLLQSQVIADMQGFLDTCMFCPHEAALRGRVQSMQDIARTAALEGEIWQRIKDDTTRDRLAIYVENCTLCDYRDEALTRIGLIDARAAASDEEERAFADARDSRDLAALRAYAEGCVACAHIDAARALISEVEADESYRAERALLADAVASRNPAKLDAYMTSCTVCDGREDISATLELLARLDKVRAPCLALAGLPQAGGPRKLEDIDRGKATAVCGAAAREFPEDGLLRTMMGRIAQAGGDLDRARRAYDFGMEQEVPAAFGLAAYAQYAPGDGSRIDLERAEALAAQGAALGDWLSQEILTVLYSKDLVPGKTPKDAFDVAQMIANEGNPLAQFFVGYYYLTGTGTEKSDSMAEEWLGKSVAQGYTHAYSFLAELNERGGGADVAARLYWEALEKGDPTARDRLTTQIEDRDEEVIRLIQERLRDAGLYRGAVDGVPGPGTAAAIREYAESVTEQG